MNSVCRPYVHKDLRQETCQTERNSYKTSHYRCTIVAKSYVQLWKMNVFALESNMFYFSFYAGAEGAWAPTFLAKVPFFDERAPQHLTQVVTPRTFSLVFCPFYTIHLLFWKFNLPLGAIWRTFWTNMPSWTSVLVTTVFVG